MRERDIEREGDQGGCERRVERGKMIAGGEMETNSMT